MNFKYNKVDDVLLIELNNQKIDYAEQTGDLIVHFSPKRQAVLLEFLDASKFLRQIAAKLPNNIMQSIYFPSSSPSIAYKKK